MELLNETRFEFAPIVGKVSPPQDSLTLIVKGTFRLSQGERATLLEEQLLPTGDELYEDDDEGQGSCRYSSDFAYYKPHTDLLLVGNCHPPEGKAVSSCRVTFQVGDYAKPLAVFGNRYWQGTMRSQSAPEAFTSMPLRYENSFGGDGFKKNPVGKGSGTVQQENGTSNRPLPNIENMQRLIGSPGDKPDPVGFGPLGQMWQERYSKMGSYKGSWLKERWPWFPEDFDWSHFNAAPTDMQVKDYLNGNEELFFENLHPVHSQYRSSLPGLRIRLFIDEWQQTTQDETQFKEVTMNLDTLWVDMEAEQLVLLWRGITKVLSEDYEEIQHMFVVSEKLEEPEQSIDYYYDLFLKKLAEEKSDEIYEVSPVEEDEAIDTTEIDEEIAKAEAQMKASFLEAGIDPDNLPEPTPEQKAEEAKLLKELGYGEEIEKPLLTREHIIEGAKSGATFANENLTGLDLSQINIENLNLQATIMSGVNLRHTDLSGAMLAEANLAQADLSNAILRGANLKDADLTAANLTNADLTAALLEGALFEKAEMNKAILDQVDAIDAIFSEANLTEATFRNSTLQGSDFSKCILYKANFQGADLSEASVDGAAGQQVNMAETDLTELRASNGCNFSQGSFRQATGKESIWETAILAGADFTYSQMEGADFSSANLTSADLSAANMKFARFTKANLSEAILVQMNLFQGSLEKANLTRTNFRGSNLYGVEFLDAILAETDVERSNLKMTKLSNR